MRVPPHEHDEAHILWLVWVTLLHMLGQGGLAGPGDLEPMGSPFRSTPPHQEN